MMYDGKLFDYTAGCYCGLLVTEDVMKKLAVLQHKHLEQVRALLTDAVQKKAAFASHWTLHYPNGEQTTVNFIDTSINPSERIKLATHAHAPRFIPTVFIASSMDEAKKLADERFAAQNTEPAITQ